MEFPWDVLLLQETFRKTMGVKFDSDHVIISAPKLEGNLRAPAIILQSEFGNYVKTLGGGTRWVAAELTIKGRRLLLISAHLPHKRLPTERLSEVIGDIEDVISKYPHHEILMGVDTNTKMYGTSDNLHVGPAVPASAHSAKETERAGIVHEFLAKNGLTAQNTWTKEPVTDKDLFTRRSWEDKALLGDGAPGVQVDFIFTSLKTKAIECKVLDNSFMNTDHSPVALSVGMQREPRPKRSPRPPRGWRPSAEWISAVESTDWNWGLWHQCADNLVQMADTHTHPDCQPSRDAELLKLLAHREDLRGLPYADQDIQVVRKISRLIWRRRRFLKRKRALSTLDQDVAHGRAPQDQRRGVHINYLKLFECKDPIKDITTYYYDLFNVNPDDQKEARKLTERWCLNWQSLKIDITGVKLTRQKIQAALKKLKLGKSSADGITAEILSALPPLVFDSFADDMDRRCRNLDFDISTTQAAAVLLPKTLGAHTLDKFRPIACLTAMRKLWGYLWLQSLPRITFGSFQTAFVKGAHPLQGAQSVLTAAEKAREWDIPLFIAQIDLKKAFDHVDREAAHQALREHGVGVHHQAWLAKLWQEHTLEMRLGKYTSQRFTTSRGLPQGAPESPFVFTVLVDTILMRLNSKWEKNGGEYGFKLDNWWFPSVAYADDIIIAATSQKALEQMISDLTTDFKTAGLEIGHNKTNWSSTTPLPGVHLQAEEARVLWQPTFVFVGIEMSLQGTSAPAIKHRMGRAQATLNRWSSVLRCPWVPAAKRIRVMLKSVWPSLLWGAAVWHPTKEWQDKLSSWGARVAASVAGVKRGITEEIGDWWRRMHRVGHNILEQHGGDANRARRLQLHQWAGHLARLPADSTSGSALRARGLQWWRYAQHRHSSKWDGVHTKRFKCWRWEAQIANVYGDGCSEVVSDNTGWLERAQDRQEWKRGEHAFASCKEC